MEKKKSNLYLVLCSIFIASAIIGEVIGGKLINIFGFTASIGVIPWPVVFIVTDLINEYFGKESVKKITYITSLMIVYLFAILFICLIIPANKSLTVINDEQFYAVFGQSLWIIIGSITAFLTSQLIDATIFQYIKKKFGKKFLGARATISTIFSQLIDTFIVQGIAFWLPGKLSFSDYIDVAFSGYLLKLIIAILLTPFIYLGYYLVERYLK